MATYLTDYIAKFQQQLEDNMLEYDKSRTIPIESIQYEFEEILEDHIPEAS